MNITINHKLEDEQKDELKEELDQALEDLKVQVEKMFDGWERTKRVCIYTIIGASAVSFIAGYVAGISKE